MPHHVFISYSQEDKASADRVRELIEAQGITCWIAWRDIPAGSRWGAAIVEAIEGARVMVLLISAHGSESQQIPRELEIADDRHIPIIPLRLEPFELKGEFKYFLSNRQWMDCFPQPVDPYVPAVVAVIREALQGPSTSQKADRGTGAGTGTAVKKVKEAEPVLVAGARWTAVLRLDPEAPSPFSNLDPSLRPEVVRTYSAGSRARAAVLLVNDGSQSMVSRSLSPQQWEIDYRNIAAQGQRLVRLTCSRTAAGATLTGIWQPGLFPGTLWRFLSLAERGVFQSFAQQFFAANMTVTDVSVSPIGGIPGFAGVWTQLGIASAMNIGMSWPQLEAQQMAMNAQGYRMIALSGYAENSAANYAAAWHFTGPRRQILMPPQPASQFQSQCDQFSRQGMRLALLDAFDLNGVDQYAGVWEA
jgi:hypothetical protein